jgi:DNA-directed RNA polymerase subunit beta'
MVSSIGVMLDHNNRDIVEPVRSTYTEGLSTSEFFSHMYGNRKGMIDKSQSVKDPGALTKQVIVSAAGYRVTMSDCGTSQGLMEPVAGTQALDRYLAEAAPGVGVRNELVTRRVLDAARVKGMTAVKVRSAMTCTAPSGVCARCYGLDEEGKPASVGDHVGIKDTQGLTEPSTQLAMKTFHTGGVSTGKANLSTGFDRVKKLFTMPDTVRDKAVLAETGGRVESIAPNPFGGTLVTVAGVKHRVPVARAVAVRIGDQVVKGARLSDGDIQPQDMLRLNGLRAMQVQLRDDIGRVYSSGGERIHAKTIEVPVRMLTESVRISDAGDHPSLIPGDYSTYGRVDAWNRVNGGKKPVKYVHLLPGSEILPHKSDDWAQRMAHNRISQVLQEGPSMGLRAPLAGGSPFASLVFGKKIEQDPWRSGGLTSGRFHRDTHH